MLVQAPPDEAGVMGFVNNVLKRIGKINKGLESEDEEQRQQAQKERAEIFRTMVNKVVVHASGKLEFEGFINISSESPEEDASISVGKSDTPPTPEDEIPLERGAGFASGIRRH